MKLTAVSSLLACLLGALLANAADIPVEHFFRDPTFRSVKLSPDGSHLAVLVRYDNIMNLAIVDLETNKPQIITLEKQDISEYHWVNNERLIYMTDRATDVNLERTGGIYAVNKNGKLSRALVLPLGGGESRDISSRAVARYIGPDPDSDRRILVSINERSQDYPDIYSMDAYSGRKKRVVLNTVNARGFSSDIDDEIRFAYQTEYVGKTTVYIRHPKTKKWEVMTVLEESNADWTPLDFSLDRDTFLVETNLGRDRSAIIRYNWKEDTSELIYEDPLYDVDVNNAIYEIKKRDECVGIVYETDKPKVVYFDKQHEILQGMIDKALPNTFNELRDADDKGQKLLILSSSDRSLPTYYLLDLNGFQLTELTNIAPWLEPESVAPKTPFSFTASDGSVVHGYLTLPREYKKGERIPLILNPHGGPWGRDKWRSEWYFDNEPKFYADRGFAVIQVDFRGSTGYGSKFYNDHLKNIERMYLDTVEAADWAIEEGIAHPERIGITGASWGGYKTMICMVKRPEMMKFGINIFGMVDIPKHINNYKTWDRPEAYNVWIDRIGDPKDPEDLANLKEWSPITHIDKIKGPVFIYHGVRDYNVDIDQSRMLVNALDRLKHPYVKVFDADEMHSLENQDLRIEVYQKIDEFLMPFRKKWGLIE